MIVGDVTLNGIRQVPAEIRDRILEIGERLDDTLVDDMERLYSPLLGGRGRREVSIKKDISYGSHGQQVLDVHTATKGGDGLTSVLFFHGGGFVRGYKNVAGDLLYGNVATYFARHGMIGVNATYRLAPDHPCPQERMMSAPHLVGQGTISRTLVGILIRS